MTILFQKLISVIISYEQQFYIESKNWKYWKTVNKPVVNIWKISYQGTRLKISLFYCETSHYLPFFRVHVSFFSKIILKNCRLTYLFLCLFIVKMCICHLTKVFKAWTHAHTCSSDYFMYKYIHMGYSDSLFYVLVS